MADHFTRAAGFAGDETTEASMMPGRRPPVGLDTTIDETNAYTGHIEPPASSNRILGPSQRVPSTEVENRRVGSMSSNGTIGKAASIRIPAQRVPLQPSNSQSGSAPNSRPSSSQAAAPRPSSSQSGPRRSIAIPPGAASNPATMFSAVADIDMMDDEDPDSSDEMNNQPNMTAANETSLQSADASEWQRHIKDAKSKAGVGIKQMEQRVQHLIQERDDLKIEVDMLRRQYNPDERASELIRLRQENIRITNHRLTLSELLTSQKKVIKDLQKQAKEMANQPDTVGDRDLRRRLQEMEEAVRMLDAQKTEEAEARQRAEDDAEARRVELLDLQRTRDELIDELEEVKAEREDIDQETYKLEKERDKAEAESAAWQSKAEKFERRCQELEEETENRAETSRAQRDERHTREREQMESELDAKAEELRAYQLELQEARGQLEALASEAAVFKGEAEAHRGADEDKYNSLRDELATKSNELMQLEEEHEELLQGRKADEEELNDLSARFEDLQRLLEEKEAEILDCNREIAQQSEMIQQLEEDQELSIADANDADQARAQMEEDLQAQKDHYEMKMEGLKSRLADAAAELSEAGERLQMTEEESQAIRAKLDAYRERMKERNEELDAALATNAKLDQKVQDLLADLKDEERNREVEEGEWERKMDALEDDMRKIIDEKEDALAALDDEIDSLRRSLKDRNADLEALQQALQARETDRANNKTSAADRHLLDLEIDRLRRDIARCEADLTRAHSELDRKDEVLREKTTQMNKMYSENAEISAKLATETQNRLGLDERLAAIKNTLRDTQSALEASRVRTEELEKQKNDDADSTLQLENSVKRQLLERNQLLVTVSQHMLKILGSDSATGTPRKRLDGEPKPSTDFGAFHSMLIGRISQLSDVKVRFERRAQRIEASFTDSFNSVKRQQDSRFKQLDRAELALKNAADKQSQWRQRLVVKQGELDVAKNTVSELQSQISSLKTRTVLASPGDNTKLTSLTQRANNAEKRLITAQGAASVAEDRLAEAKSKYTDAEAKWLARIRELEARCKAAEEKVKRERQGAKERVAEQMEQRRKLERDVEEANRRLENVDQLQKDLHAVGRR